MADTFGHELIERDGVTETAATRMRSRGQEAIVRRVATIDVGVRDAGEDAEIISVRLQEIEVRRRLVVLTLAGRKEVVGYQAKVVANTQHAARLHRGGWRGREGRRHGVKHRQREQHAGSSQEATTGDGALEGDVRRVGRS